MHRPHSARLTLLGIRRMGSRIPLPHHRTHHHHPKVSFSYASNAVLDKTASAPVNFPTPSPLSKIATLPIHHHNHTLHYSDMRNTLLGIIIHIVSFYNDNTCYTTAFTIQQLSPQIQFNIDRAGDFSLITKLGRKHMKFSVAIINHPSDDGTPFFTSIA